MEQEVIDVLQAEFKGIDVTLDELPGGRLSGRVVWAGFAEWDHVERQNRIRSVLRDKLGDAARNVGVLLAYTPHELEVMEAA
jgi:hypothetical protein